MNAWDEVLTEDFKGDTDMSLFVETFGLDAAKKYIEIFGGDSVYVPKAESVIRMGRDRKIYREFKEKNVSIDELAARYGLTPRHIRVILQDQKRLNRQVNEKQLEMF